MSTTFDDVLNGARTAAAKVGKEAEKLIDATKLRFNAAEVRCDLDKKYADLGRCVYAAQKNGECADDVIAQYAAEIDALKQRLNSINGEAAEKRNKKMCQNCGEVVEKTARYCRACGSEV